jgi:hypothetical protein
MKSAAIRTLRARMDSLRSPESMIVLGTAHGRTIAQTASFLCRDAPEVREKMKELGLVENRRAARA